MLDETRIEELCKENNYTCRCFYDTALVTTGIDTWKLKAMQTSRGDDLIIVSHQNKKANKNGKMKFHRQRVSLDVDWIFDNIIIPHGRGNRAFQKAFKIKELLKI